MMNVHSKQVAVFTRTLDLDTDLVIDWLNYLGHKVYRINGKDIINYDTSIFISNTYNKTQIGTVNASDLDVVWFRKGESVKINYSDFLVEDKKIQDEIHEFLFHESVTLKDAIFNTFGDTKTINIKSLFGFNKIFNLRCATDVGLKVPPPPHNNNIF